MKRNWEYKNIEECLEKVTVVSKLQTKDFLSKGKFPIVSQEVDYISGYWNNDSDVVRLFHPVVVFGDHSRVVKYIDFDFVVGADGVKILSPKDFLNPKFLYYFVKSADIPSLGYSRHYKLLREKDVPVPPLEEQSRIVAELDLLTGIIDKQNAQLKELDNLAQAIFYDMFGDPIENPKGWEIKTIQSVAEKYSDGPFGSNLKSEHYQQDGVRIIRLQNIGVNEFVDLDKAFISEEHYEVLKKYSCYPGDVVIGTLGEPNLRACVIPNSIYLAVNKADCILCRLKKDLITAIYFSYVMNEEKFVHAQCQAFSHGQTRARISAGQLKNAFIPLPPLSLQQSFAEKIQSIEKQKETIRASIADTQKLLDYTMDKYFG